MICFLKNFAVLLLLLLLINPVGAEPGPNVGGWIGSMVFAPDGRRSYQAGDDPTIEVWKDQRFVRYLIGHSAAVCDLAISSDGEILASRGRDDKVILWDLSTATPLQDFEVETDYASSVAISPNSKFVACDSKQGEISFHSMTSGTRIRSWKAHPERVTDLAFSHDGTRLVSCGADGYVRIWATASGKLLTEWEADNSWLHAVHFLADDRLITVGDSGEFRTWSPQGELKQAVEIESDSSVVALAVSKDARVAAVATSKGKVKKIDIANGGTLEEMLLPSDWPARSVALSSEGTRLLASGMMPGSILLHDGKSVRLTGPDTSVVQAARFGAMGYRLWRRGETVRAIESYEKALSLEPKRLQYLEGLVRSLESSARYPEAVDLLEERLSKSKLVWERVGVLEILAACLNRWGLRQARARLFEEAATHYQKAAEYSQQTQDSEQQIWILRNLAATQGELNVGDDALATYEQALLLSQRNKDLESEAQVELDLGDHLHRMGRFAESKRRFLRSAAIFEELDLPKRQASALNNLAVLVWALGDLKGGYALHEKASDLDPTNEVLVGNTGYTLVELGELDQAEPYLDKAERLYKLARSRAGEASILRYRALLESKRGNLGQAKKHIREALALNEDLLEFTNIRRSRVMLAGFLMDSGSYEEAGQELQMALQLARRSQSLENEASILADLMRVERKRKNPRLAVFYGKQCINGYQKLRTRLLKMEKSVQQQFLNAKEDTYRELADLLLGLGRYAEAQQALDLLKEEEYFDFVRRDSGAVGGVGHTAETPLEAEYRRRYEDLSGRVTVSGLNYATLLDRKRNDPSWDNDDEIRFQQAQRNMDAVESQFQAFLGELGQAFSKVGRAREVTELENSRGKLQGVLGELGPRVAAIYTLVAPDRYHAILITPEATFHGSYPIAEEELNRKIGEFTLTLRSPVYDPRNQAEELYKILIGPIEEELNAGGFETVMWSLDGALRYLPIQALHNGSGYVVESDLHHTVFTPAKDDQLADPPSPNWSVLAMGVSEKTKGFDALPNVPLELDSIVREKVLDPGVLPGEVFLDRDFKKNKFREMLSLSKYPVVHVASHFRFQPGSEVDSYLLLGDGTWSLAEMKVELRNLKGVDLLTLSACNTATGDNTGEGTEVEGLAVVAQRKGARAVLASLWPVADESTRYLMQEFYRARAENPQGSKVEALKGAKLALMRNRLQISDKERTFARSAGADKPDAPLYKTDPSRPFAHPYYWAPFVLIGNWL